MQKGSAIMPKKSNKAMASIDDDWRKREDARTLIESEAIKKDPKRKKAAVTMTKQMMAEKLQEMQSMRAIANKKV